MSYIEKKVPQYRFWRRNSRLSDVHTKCENSPRFVFYLNKNISGAFIPEKKTDLLIYQRGYEHFVDVIFRTEMLIKDRHDVTYNSRVPMFVNSQHFTRYELFERCLYSTRFDKCSVSVFNNDILCPRAYFTS